MSHLTLCQAPYSDLNVRVCFGCKFQLRIAGSVLWSEGSKSTLGPGRSVERQDDGAFLTLALVMLARNKPWFHADLVAGVYGELRSSMLTDPTHGAYPNHHE